MIDAIMEFLPAALITFGVMFLLVPVALFGLFGAFWFLVKGNINGHRKTMQSLYFGACVVAGGFTLLPGRYLGDLLWGQLALI